MAIAGLIRRLVKGTPLTAAEHDGNLDALEGAIDEIALTPGPAGPAGAAGAAGPAGAKGDTGATGATGPQGPAGPAGPAGPQGPAGAKGDTGAAGPAGATGPAGAAGSSAYQLAVAAGFSGTETQWLASLVGPQGPAGPAGSTGAEGSSAYQVAVANGFVGTEAQWLASLVGAQGPTGPTGPQGPAGPTPTLGPNQVFAGPASGGTAAPAVGRVMVGADLPAIGDGLILTVSNRGETATASTNYVETPVPVPSGSFDLVAVRFGCHIDATGSGASTFNAYRRTPVGVKTSVLTGNATLTAGASLVDASATITGGTFAAGDRIGVDLMGVGTGAQGLFAQFLFTRSAT
jgi:hypothetical protein